MSGQQAAERNGARAVQRARSASHDDAGILASACEAFGFAGLNSTDCVFANPSFVDV